ncbi:MAG: tRNA-dihydrouridine synthase [Patescibacteria group bacterium]|nr:tRNA-dihydrouridine synthase [Patescibacteria group bacterium]
MAPCAVFCYSSRMNFWQSVKQNTKPFFALAPMADVTDPAFRIIVAKYGKPDVLWTEFVSADGLCHPKGRESLMKDLEYSEAERPIVAQLFSSNPENMRTASKLCAELGFDGIDINMGCPDRTIEKQGCGSAMIKTPDLAIEVIRAARQGIQDAGKDIPLSVKTRVGYSRDEIDTWVVRLLGEKLDALTIHARTRKDLSQVPANWDYLSQVVKLRNEIAPETVILGNGDVTDMSDGISKAKSTGADGIMIGRAVFGNPWIFNKEVSIKKKGSWKQNFFLQLLPPAWAKKIMGDSRYTISDIPLAQKLNVMVEHTRLFEKLLGGVKNFAVMKKHYKAYATGFPGAKELRIKLMETKNGDDMEAIVAEFLNA